MRETDRIGARLRQLFSFRHYYGDTVRFLFLIAAIITLLLVPLGAVVEPGTAGVLILIALLLVLFAGLTNPRQYSIALANSIISGLAFLFFEFIAVGVFNGPTSVTEPVFFITQLLAFNFLIAFYFSIKTVRGMNMLDEEEPAPEPHHRAGQDPESWR